MDSREESLKLQAEFKDCQKLLTAIGDETRQYLLSILIMEKCSGARVVDIAAKTNLSRPAVSHHMQILKDAGFVKARKEGTCIYYALDADTDALEKMQILVGHIDKLIKSEKHDEFINYIKEQEI